MTTLMASLMLTHNHGNQVPGLGGRTGMTWCGECGGWFIPLSAADRAALDRLIDDAVSQHVTEFEEAADAAWIAHDEAVEAAIVGE